MSLLIGLLSFALFLVCLFLCLLVLVQLPKKEAGMGQAFGGGTTDALFGAGAGNALTNLTKYSAGAFLVLSLTVSVLGSQAGKSKTKGIRDELGKATASASASLGTAVTNAVKTATNAVAPAK
ncbi:MAG: preprotein translocase subunit SecG [Verrucomicrobiota bacterium]